MKLKKSDLEELLKSKDPYDYEKFWNDRHLNDHDYSRHVVMTGGGMSVDETLKKVATAGEEELLAYMTMLFREDHFSESLPERFAQGWPQKIVGRLISFAE